MSSSQFTSQLRRRREASRRLAPLSCGRRDPHDPLPRESWTEHERESWRDAWNHLREHGHDVLWAVPTTVKNGHAA